MLGAIQVPGFGALGSSWWQSALVLLTLGHLTNVCISLYLHRAQTHRGLSLHPIASLAMRCWLWLSTAINTREWVSCHRKHHAFPDVAGDPHSPVREGLLKIVFGGYFYYRHAIREPGLLEKYGAGTPNDWLERQLFSRRSWLGLLLMLIVDVYLCGPIGGGLVWIGQILWVPLWAAGIVNGVGHAAGYRNFDVKDHSRNILPLAILLGGEELHNNHHADPHCPKFSSRWFELDIGWTYIRVLSAFGLARPSTT